MKAKKARKASTIAREGFFLEFAEKVKAMSKVPLMLTGGFITKDGIEHALTVGRIDMVGLGRSVCVDPAWPQKVVCRNSHRC